MEANLVHGEGELLGRPYRLERWMKATLYRGYEYDAVSLRRFVERIVIGVGKGNAKTEFAAAIGAFEAAGPSVPTADGRGKLRDSPNVPVAAASRDQANMCFGALAAMITEGPLSPFFDVQQFEIKLKGRRGKLYRIAAEAGSQDGTLPTAFIADEVHEWTGNKKRVHTVVTNSLRKRRGVSTGGAPTTTLEVNISTAGDPANAELLLGMYEYGLRVKSGEIVDSSFLFVWFEPSDKDLDLSDPVALRVALREANPSSWAPIEDLALAWERGTIPEHVFRRYHLNQWVSDSAAFLPHGAWDACVSDQATEDALVFAFDGSFSRDATAIYGCTPDGHVFRWRVWERPPTDKEWKVPRSEVDVAVAELMHEYPDAVLHCDPAKWPSEQEEWAGKYGAERVLAFPQSNERMVPATAKFYAAVVEGELSHDGDPTLARHVGNAVTKQLGGERFTLRKKSKELKIDACIAAVMAYDRATATVEEGQVPSISFW